MDEKDKNLELTPEELKAEEESTKEVPETELKEKLAEEFGIDPETDAELLEKLVNREKAQREKLSTAIRQKRDWREKAKKQLPVKKDEKGTPDVNELVARTVKETLEERDLETVTASDEIKTEIKELAKLKGISVRAAAKLPYIVNRIQEDEKDKRIEDATPKRSNRGAKTVKYDPSKPLDPADFALDTPEGQKAWQDAKAARRNHTG